MAWTGPRGRQSAGTATRNVTRLWPSLIGCASGSASGAGAVPGRLEDLCVAAGGGRGHGDLDGHVASGAARGPRGATSSSTSAGRPPDPSGGRRGRGRAFLGRRPCTADQHVSQTNVCDTEDEAGSGLTERLSGSRLRLPGPASVSGAGPAGERTARRFCVAPPDSRRARAERATVRGLETSARFSPPATSDDGTQPRPRVHPRRAGARPDRRRPVWKRPLQNIETPAGGGGIAARDRGRVGTELRFTGPGSFCDTLCRRVRRGSPPPRRRGASPTRRRRPRDCRDALFEEFRAHPEASGRDCRSGAQAEEVPAFASRLTPEGGGG